MKVIQYIVKTAYRSSGVSLLTDRCSGAFVNAIEAIRVPNSHA